MKQGMAVMFHSGSYEGYQLIFVKMKVLWRSMKGSLLSFLYANFHQDLLMGRTIAIACPKLDHIEPYVDKVRQIIEVSEIRSLGSSTWKFPVVTVLYA
ncbi:MAG TPA: hypothetical protein EYP17_08130 [Candidatus Latescibacteria bacterium]|nr:hypothetical protein [Candidatus Latescibacterota bacterium]